MTDAPIHTRASALPGITLSRSQESFRWRHAPARSLHRCRRCNNWSKNWDLCAAARDGDYEADLNLRTGAVLDWWMEHQLGPYNEDHVQGLVDEFLNIPIAVIISTLDRCLAHARQQPRSLRYFKVALEEARGAYFKSQDTGSRRTSESTAEIVARLLARQNRQGGAS